MRVVAILVLAILLQIDCAVAQSDLDAGRRAYEVCAGCHGFVAEGSALVYAPRLAGLETWYLARQMQYFADGIRGAENGSVHGQRMATMARAVKDDRELGDLLVYIATLPARRPIATVAGDTDRGRQQFATCAACHGLQGQGNEALSAPGLAGLDDWYLVEQLRLYAEGLRGTHPADVYGQQMRALAATFADEQTRLDIAAYIDTLAR